MAEDLPDLSNLNERLDQARKPDQWSGERKNPDGRGLGMRMMMDVTSGVLVGALIGYWLDEKFETSPFFLLGSTIFGMIGGFLNMYRTNKHYLDVNEQSEKENAKNQK